MFLVKENSPKICHSQEMMGKTFCNDDDGINIDVSYAIYFTTVGAHLPFL